MIKHTRSMIMGLALSASMLAMAPSVNALPDISHDFTNAYWQDLTGKTDIVKDGLRFRTDIPSGPSGSPGGTITWNPGGANGGDPDWGQTPCDDLGYACAGDGLGISGIGDADEISIPAQSDTGFTERLSITFVNGPVNISQVSFLDLFDESTGLETAYWAADTLSGISAVGSISALQATGTNGFAAADIALMGVKTIVFGIVCEDSCANVDYSLAGMNVSPVPIPAAAWLFGSGLIGLAGIARRRKAA